MKRTIEKVDGNRWKVYDPFPQSNTGLILFTKSGKDFEIYFDWTKAKLKVEVKHIKNNKVIKTLLSENYPLD